MPAFWNVVNKVIDDADIIIEVLDARYPEESKNTEVERKVSRQGKRIIYVLNKSDLVKKPFKQFGFEFETVVWVSALKNLGTTQLRSMLRQSSKKRPLMVGILGYPNTGKSSLINCLKQRRSAGTSPKPGFTKGLQKIKIENGIYLLDTPGVIPFGEKEETRHALIAAIDPGKIKDPDLVAMHIISMFQTKDPIVFEEFYKVKFHEEPVETLELIAKKLNYLKKGGSPDIMRAARKIIEDWQRGKILL